MKHLTTVRRELAQLIKTKMTEQGVPLHDLELGRPRCPLINPACPDDLCVLPAGHIGTEERIHILGTDDYTQAERYRDFPMAEVGTEDQELIRLGAKERRRIYA